MEENPIDKDKITENPSTLPYAHTIGGVEIRPEDMGKVKGRAMTAMVEQTNRQLNQIKEQIELLAKQAKGIHDRVEVSKEIYAAEMRFEPLVGHAYYLYRKAEHQYVLSMVGPNSWGKKKMPYEEFRAKVVLLADHTWEIQ